MYKFLSPRVVASRKATMSPPSLKETPFFSFIPLKSTISTSAKKSPSTSLYRKGPLSLPGSWKLRPADFYH